jgi:hypothetical protein
MLIECDLISAKARWHGAEKEEKESRVSEGTHVIPCKEERKDGRDHVIAFPLFSLPQEPTSISPPRPHCTATHTAVHVPARSPVP